jgi:hypothetical protein
LQPTPVYGGIVKSVSLSIRSFVTVPAVWVTMLWVFTGTNWPAEVLSQLGQGRPSGSSSAAVNEVLAHKALLNYDTYRVHIGRSEPGPSEYPNLEPLAPWFARNHETDNT